MFWQGMTILWKKWQSIFFLICSNVPKLAFLPLLGHKEAISTLDYSIASKLEDIGFHFTFKFLIFEFQTTNSDPKCYTYRIS